MPGGDRILLLQDEKDSCRLTALRPLWEGPAGHGGPIPPNEANLALSLVCVSKSLLHPVLNCLIFSLAPSISNAVDRSVETSTPNKAINATCLTNS